MLSINNASSVGNFWEIHKRTAFLLTEENWLTTLRSIVQLIEPHDLTQVKDVHCRLMRESQAIKDRRNFTRLPSFYIKEKVRDGKVVTILILELLSPGCQTLFMKKELRSFNI